MSKLDLIWALENHNNSLDLLNMELEDLGKNIDTNILKEKIDGKNNEKTVAKDKINETQYFIRKNENKLQDLNYKVKEIEESLYDGKIQDIKELEYLDMEKDRYREEMDRIEIEIIQSMELEEELQIRFKELKEDLQEYREGLDLLMAKVEGRRSELTLEIEETELLIKGIIPDISKEDLANYNNIRISKQRGIVGVENYICLGCSVRIPTYFGTNLKAREDLVYCENCGRILYFLS